MKIVIIYIFLFTHEVLGHYHMKYPSPCNKGMSNYEEKTKVLVYGV